MAKGIREFIFITLNILLHLKDLITNKALLKNHTKLEMRSNEFNFFSAICN